MASGQHADDVWHFEVPSEYAGKRLDVFVVACFAANDVSREKIKRAIQEGRCRLDGVLCTKTRQSLSEGQIVELAFQVNEAQCVDAALVAAADGQLEIPILYEDEHLIVINKPAGLTVHPAPSTQNEVTLVHHLVSRFPQLGACVITGNDGVRPGIVHRLDKDTSGLMIVALTEQARLRLSAAFADHRVRKTYWALVRNVPQAEGRIDAPIARHPTLKTRMAVNAQGREALSTYRVVLADPAKRFALALVDIHTGRTHQIRVHMTHIGHPLWGDRVYGPGAGVCVGAGAGFDPAPRQMLHAGFLSFEHPMTGEAMAFSLPPSPDMLETALALSSSTRHIVVTGGAGCGKSALVEVYRALGVPVWQADKLVAKQYDPRGEAWAMFRQRYGDLFIADEHSAVDKRLLSQAMIDRPELKREVETVVHGLVRQDLEQFWAACEANHAPFAVAEIPLWFETRWGEKGLSDADKNVFVIGVWCDETQRRKRLQLNRGWSAERIAAVEAWQWPVEEKLKRCQFVVMNSGTLEDLEKQALKSLAHLAELARAEKASFTVVWNAACEKGRECFM